MTNNTDFLGRAIDAVKKAIELDNGGEYEKAYQGYYSALELFMLALKWEKNPKSKEMIRAKTAEYMDRAEKLKNHLAQSEDKKKPSAIGANGKVAQGSGKGGYGFGIPVFAAIVVELFEYHTNIYVSSGRKTTIMKMPMRRSYGRPLLALSCRTNRT